MQKGCSKVLPYGQQHVLTSPNRTELLRVSEIPTELWLMDAGHLSGDLPSPRQK
jgi:hypothetical protein